MAGRAAQRFAALCSSLAAIMLVLMTLEVVGEVIARNFFSASLPGTLALVQYLWMPGIALLGLGLAQACNETIRVTVMLDLAAARVRRVVEIAIEAVCAAFAAVAAFYSAGELIESVVTRERSPVLAWVVLWPGKAFVLLAFVALLIGCCIRIVRLARGSERETGLPANVEEIAGRV